MLLVLILIGVTLSSLGGIVSLAIGLVIAYYSFKRFIRTDSLFVKIVWVIIGLSGLSIAISGIPSLFGIAAAILLYYLYQDYKERKQFSKTDKDFDENWKVL
jgi:lia operon protein LiaI